MSDKPILAFIVEGHYPTEAKDANGNPFQSWTDTSEGYGCSLIALGESAPEAMAALALAYPGVAVRSFRFAGRVVNP